MFFVHRLFVYCFARSKPFYSVTGAVVNYVHAIDIILHVVRIFALTRLSLLKQFSQQHSFSSFSFDIFDWFLLEIHYSTCSLFLVSEHLSREVTNAQLKMAAVEMLLSGNKKTNDANSEASFFSSVLDYVTYRLIMFLNLLA